MIALAVLVYVGVCIMEAMNNSMANYALVVIKPLVSVLEVSSIYYLFTKLVDGGKLKTSGKVYHILEENSFGLYLFHQQIIYFVIVWLNDVVPPIVLAFLLFLIASLMSLVMSTVLRKWRVTRWMFGL